MTYRNDVVEMHNIKNKQINIRKRLVMKKGTRKHNLIKTFFFIRRGGNTWTLLGCHPYQQISSPVPNPTPEGDYVAELCAEEFPFGRPRDESPGKGFRLGPLAQFEPELLHY